jgi:hypothetical protein
MQRDKRSARRRLTWGIVLLVFGALALAVNLGVTIPRDLWDYWPGLLLAMGVAQLAWPGTARDRLSGYWLIAVGIYGFVSVFEMFGLHWGTSWPILLVALGIRIVLGGFFRDDGAKPKGNPQDEGGVQS